MQRKPHRLQERFDQNKYLWEQLRVSSIGSIIMHRPSLPPKGLPV